jgi:imidazole glycerol-phosphate synthase subunit HisH
MIAIVDYGAGNSRAIGNLYGRLGIPHTIAEAPEQLESAERFVLPGVGAFDQCMGELNRSGMREALETHVRELRKPILGICVGMQLLARSSEEGAEPGLGWIAGRVLKLQTAAHGRPPLPHMGWNTVRPVRNVDLFAGVDLSIGYYFLHSYYFSCERPEDVLAVAEYGTEFACAVHHENVFGVQFHPEKSHQAGIQLLKNFALL